jgi:hypothetical protein
MFNGTPTEECQAVRRCRNIVAALENLLTQLNGWDSPEPLAVLTRTLLDVYRFELKFYQEHLN